jgi:hypothetical protein
VSRSRLAIAGAVCLAADSECQAVAIPGCPRRATQVRGGALPHPYRDGADTHERDCWRASTLNDAALRPGYRLPLSDAAADPAAPKMATTKDGVPSVAAAGRVALFYKLEFRIVDDGRYRNISHSRGKQQE